MKILTGKDIRQADLSTIENEPVSSIELMERAAEAMAGEICNLISPDGKLLFFIGKGNNGGDGLAMARILANAGFSCSIILVYPANELSEDCRFNYERLPEEIKVKGLSAPDDFDGYDIIIDAILGAGLKGYPEGNAAHAISLINNFPGKVISIDIPSGMHTEPPDNPEKIVRADITLAIEFPKLSMLLPEAGNCCGTIIPVDICLDNSFIGQATTPYFFVNQDDIVSRLKKRDKFSHKGDYGHALIIAGSSGMMGAAVLSVCGALRSGCGLVTAHIPEKQAMAVFTSSPSAIVSADKGKCFTSLPSDLDKFTVCGLGPGLGQKPETIQALTRFMHAFIKPLVLDADALNIVSKHTDLVDYIPSGSVLTPHPGEFERLVGSWESESEKLSKLQQLSTRLDSTIVLKGAHTAICHPDGNIYFNPTGSPAMAKGGSGDVLTGFIAGLMARGYCGKDAALLGVYLHGLGGEKAAEYYGEEPANSSDLPDFIAEAYREVQSLVD